MLFWQIKAIAKRLYFEYASASCRQYCSTAKRADNVIKLKSIGYMIDQGSNLFSCNSTIQKNLDMNDGCACCK